MEEGNGSLSSFFLLLERGKGITRPHPEVCPGFMLQGCSGVSSMFGNTHAPRHTHRYLRPINCMSILCHQGVRGVHPFGVSSAPYALKLEFRFLNLLRTIGFLSPAFVQQGEFSGVTEYSLASFLPITNRIAFCIYFIFWFCCQIPVTLLAGIP